jgi:mannose-1-phosphate guanylyltransferase
LTETTPKCLIPVAGKPMLDYWLDALEGAGIDAALLNTHHLRAAVKTWLDTANRVP